MRRLLFVVVVTLVVFSSVHAQQLESQFDAFDFNRRLGQGVNLGNALEAPREGAWGVRLEAWYFEAIAAGGFDSVRVPIKWSAHADDDSPYRIDEGFLERIDWVIEQAQRNGLAAVLNVHHYDEIHSDVEGHQDRLAGIWSQIARRYQDMPRQDVYFEILNEPNAAFTDLRWRATYEQSLAAIRETNPDRTVLVGGINWNSANGLTRLRLPEDDRNLIGTFHYYDPFAFTHQGAEWVDNSDPWLGTTWDASDREQRAIESTFSRIVRWSNRYDRPVYMGEFGAYSRADMDSRARWTEFVADQAEANDFSWSYWEFGAGFGVMDRSTREWIEPLYQSLSPTSLLNLDGTTGYGVGDADLMVSAIVGESTEGRFDLDGDQVVTPRDLDYWVYFSGHRLGDANLDGRVDFNDFAIVSSNFGTSATNWSGGDFNANGVVDFGDFLRLSDNFSSSNSGATVPEPSPGLQGKLVIFLAILFVRQATGRLGRFMPVTQ